MKRSTPSKSDSSLNSSIPEKSELPRAKLNPEAIDDDFETVEFEDSSKNYTSPKNFSSMGFLMPINKIRWFYDNKAMTAIHPVSLSAVDSEAAKRAHQEKTVKEEWKCFNGNDSFRLELEYRRACLSSDSSDIAHQSQLETEYKVQNSANAALAGTMTAAAADADLHGFEQVTNTRPKALSNLPKIEVMGGMYEVEILSKECFPIYWQGESIAVRRGVWFFENSWLPVGECKMKKNSSLTLLKRNLPDWMADPEQEVLAKKAIV